MVIEESCLDFDSQICNVKKCFTKKKLDCTKEGEWEFFIGIDGINKEGRTIVALIAQWVKCNFLKLND